MELLVAGDCMPCRCRLMAADELTTIQAIKVFREAAENIAVEHGGRLVDSPGDNLLRRATVPVTQLTRISFLSANSSGP
jgi:hypothetical protein